MTNKAELLRGLPQGLAEKAGIMLDIVDYVLEKISPENLIGDFFEKKDLSGFEKIAIFAIGKAANQMANTTEKSLKKYHNRNPDIILLADVGHPLPTKAGLNKTKKIISAAKKLAKNDLAIVLISGGGSAMFVAPLTGITLNDEIKITQQLLKAGAPIQELNTVRKQLSQVKGGHFAEILYPATVWGLVISDVIGNDLSLIASGPISRNKSTPQNALNILKKYKIEVPKKVLEILQARKTAKFKSLKSKNVHVDIIADHFSALNAAVEKAKKLNLKVTSSKKLIQGEAGKVAPALLRKIKTKAGAASKTFQKHIFIVSGETTVTCKGGGYGGRNQEFVLSGLKYLQAKNESGKNVSAVSTLSNYCILSIGTDGVDGICPEPIAGAIGHQTILQSAQKQHLKIDDFLNHNDSYTFFKKTNGLIKTGPTGTNLGDLILIFGGRERT